MDKMQAAVFVEKGKIQLREVPKPVPGPGEALLQVTLTTICGTDVHILKGEYPVKPGLVVGHEPVGRVLDAFAAGLGDITVVTTLCPGGKERMRRLMAVIGAKRAPFRDLVTHSFRLADIEAAYDLFSHQRDGVMKVAIRP